MWDFEHFGNIQQSSTFLFSPIENETSKGKCSMRFTEYSKKEQDNESDTEVALVNQEIEPPEKSIEWLKFQIEKKKLELANLKNERRYDPMDTIEEAKVKVKQDLEEFIP